VLNSEARETRFANSVFRSFFTNAFDLESSKFELALKSEQTEQKRFGGPAFNIFQLVEHLKSNQLAELCIRLDPERL
jgi:hypothetical protein